MIDTSAQIARIQYDIVMSKPITQRLQLTDQMIQQSRSLALLRLKKNNPECSNKELKLLLIQEYYGTELNPVQLIALKKQLLASTSSAT